LIIEAVYTFQMIKSSQFRVQAVPQMIKSLQFRLQAVNSVAFYVTLHTDTVIVTLWVCQLGLFHINLNDKSMGWKEYSDGTKRASVGKAKRHWLFLFHFYLEYSDRIV